MPDLIEPNHYGEKKIFQALIHVMLMRACLFILMA